MPSIKLVKGCFVPSRPEIAREEPLLLRINGRDYATLMASPGMEKELALGFCFSEGIIEGLKEVAFLHYCGSGQETAASGRVVEIRLVNQRSLPQRSLEVRSGCGICGRVMLEELSKQLSPINSSLTVSTDLLFQMSERMLSGQKLFKSTGSTHAAAIFDSGGKLLAQAEDLGRHNALDKLIGLGLLQQLPFSEAILLLSGRNSYEMTLKTLRAQIPLLASLSGATSLAIQLAETMGCTLVGFLRKPSLEVYTHPDRVVLPTSPA